MTVGLVAGFTLAILTIPVVWTAEGRLIVGDHSLAAASIPGYAVATQQLAADYSRYVDSDAVVRALSQRFGDGKTVEVDASPIPQSAVLRVEASAPSAEAAVEAADLAGDGLRAKVSSLGGGSQLLQGLESDYVEATRTLGTAEEQLTRAKAAEEAGQTEDVVAAQASVDMAKLRLAALQDAIRGRISATSASAGQLQWLAHARTTKNNRRSSAEIGGLLGGLAGLGVAWLLLARRSAQVDGYTRSQNKSLV